MTLQRQSASIPTVAHLMTSVSRGGLELYACELIQRLHGAGVRQVVVCNRNAFMAGDLKKLGIPTEYLKAGSRYSLFRIFRLRQIDKKYQVGIWHSHQRDDMIVTALAFFFRKNFRHIFSLYMGFARKKDLLHRLVYRRLESLVTTSEAMNALALDRLPVTPEQVHLIRYGRDEADFKLPAARVKTARKITGAKPGQKVVISLSRLDPMKGVREFAEAGRKLPRAMQGKFVFVQIGERTIMGFDEHKKPLYLPESEAVFDMLRREEQNTRGRARFVLLPFQKNFIPFLKAADYFVLGSYDEMYSLSVIDAMMAGLPVIGTDNGGTVEQLAQNRGFLVPAKNPSAIAAALITLEKNPKERRKICQASAKWVHREHTWQAVMPQWLELYTRRSA
jgi:D-inositol-3-phosphate glycosyltransferase